jgi:hypothetical protein
VTNQQNPLFSLGDRTSSSVEARDLIDLAILRLHAPIPSSAIDKLEGALNPIA